VDLITPAIPFFFLLMGVEHVVGRGRGRRIFRGPDVVADLSLGVMQVLVGVMFAFVIVGGYRFIYAHWRFWDVPSTWWSWAALFVGVDFFYYWFHRSAHRINIAWASHAPHHSSEDYNLAVALRQGPVQPLCSMFFYLPLAFVGFPPEMFVTMGGINTLYQFWIHTELIGSLGPLELVINTPSHHRVHHGCNGRYIDKNHGGILIIWDKLFGTFELEAATPIYGTVKAVSTWNPVRAALFPFAEIARMARMTPRLVDKVRVWFMPPEWVPPGAYVDKPDVEGRPKHDSRPARPVARYVTAMFVVTLLLVVAFLVAGAPKMSVPAIWAACAWLTLSFGNLGAMLDGWRGARALEVVRLAVLLPATMTVVALT
jgi:sterol desaturase/sphingolipid hydroxylase (fatty acid hydroxylase superfamily)